MFVLIVCLLLLIATFFLPYPKIHSWIPTIIGFSVTGGLAFVLIKAGIFRFGIQTLIIGIAISGWLIPNPAFVLMWLLFILISLSIMFTSSNYTDPPAADVVPAPSADSEIESGYENNYSLKLLLKIGQEATKIDEVYHSDIAEELTRIGWEVSETITDQQERAEFIATEVISKSIDYVGLIGMAAFQRTVAKIIKERKSDKTNSLSRVRVDIEKILKYLEKVTKSRKAEMINAIGVPEEQIDPLLNYLRSIGILIHEKACFWRFRTETHDN